MKLKYQAYVLLILFLSSNLANSQCCTAGNPNGATNQVSFENQNKLYLSFSYINSFSDTYFKGNQPIDKKYIENYFNFLSLYSSYGITNNLQLTADLGYFINKTQNFVDVSYERKAVGIADAGIGIIYHFFTSDDELLNINQTAKIILPVGEFNQVYDNIVLPIDLQPSSGNFRYNLGLQLTQAFENSNFSISSINNIEFSQAIITENTYHKYGNLYNLSLIGSYKINQMISSSLQARCEIRDRALSGVPSGNLKYINASGGVIGYISPQISLNMMDKFLCNFQFHYPVYKNVYGEEQLTNKYMFAVNFAKSLDFNRKSSEVKLEEFENNKDLQNYEVWVNGNCEMCQKRIEDAANEVKNVFGTYWNKDTKILKIFYKTNKPEKSSIEEAVAEVGHDTETIKAKDEVYNSLHSCCLYRK